VNFKDFYSIDPVIVNLSEALQMDEETVADLRSSTDSGRKKRSGPVGSFFENVSANWTVMYTSTAVTTPGVSRWTQYIQPVNLPGLRASLDEVRASFNGDVLAHCTCPDYRYRLEYYATQDSWNYGSGQSTPPNVTNPPPPQYGKLCKHLVNSMGVIKGSTPTILSNYRKKFL
jgi:hypothetical protein